MAPRTLKNNQMSTITQFALDVALDALQKVTESTYSKAAFVLGNFPRKFFF